MSLRRELKRRDVFKVAVAYLVASWLIVQVVGVLTEPLNLPDSLDTVVVVLLAIGFPFSLIIAWIYEVTPEGIKVTAAGHDDPGPAPRRPSERLTYVVIGLLVMAVGFTVLGYVLTPASTEFGAGSRLAVLPCDDLSPDPTNSFFAVGIHEELLTRLGSLSGLDLISRTSVLQYAGRRPPMPEIAAELDADAIIECSARYAGNLVRLTAQLIDAASDRHLWQQTYDADMSNVETLFEVQAEIATQVANALDVEFFEGEREQVARVPTDSPVAYDAYLRGKAHLSFFRNLNAAEAFQAAVDADDQFAEAWMELARAYERLLVTETEAARIDEIRQQRETAIERARELDPGLIDPDVLRAQALWERRDWVGAGRAWAAAIERDPASRSETYAGGYLVHVGRVSEGADIYADGREANELAARYTGAVGWAFDVAGRNREALAEFDRSMALNGGAPIYTMQHFQALLVAPDPDRLERFRSALELNGAEPLPELVDAWQAPAESVSILRQALNQAPETQSAARMPGWSVIAAYHGDIELALEFMREAYLRLGSNYFIYMWHPLMSEVRKTPEFKELIIEIGLDRYWREIAWADYCRPVGEDDFECS
jgi:adenylate cyclase